MAAQVDVKRSKVLDDSSASEVSSDDYSDSGSGSDASGSSDMSGSNDALYAVAQMLESSESGKSVADLLEELVGAVNRVANAVEAAVAPPAKTTPTPTPPPPPQDGAAVTAAPTTTTTAAPDA